MLSSISWQHYLSAVILLTVSYYLYVALRYYQAEIANLLNRRKSAGDMFTAFSSSQSAVMGEAKLDNGISLSETRELQFTDASPDDHLNYSGSESIVETAAPTAPTDELVQEAENLIEAFKDVDDKKEFLTLIRLLIESSKRFHENLDLPLVLNKIVQLTKGRLKFPVVISDLLIAGVN